MTKYTHLIISLIVYSVLFWLFKEYTVNVQIFSRITSFFLGSIIITLLAIYIIYGYSTLKLHRTSYLLIGLIGIICVFKFAQPMVLKTNFVSGAANFVLKPLMICSETIKLSGKVCGVDYSGKSLLDIRNKAYKKICYFLGKKIEEPPLFIWLLGLSQLMISAGIGLWIGEGVDKSSHLIPISIVAGLADIWSVMAGATSLIIVSSTIHYFFLRFPVCGEISIPQLIGLSDYLFFAIYFQSVIRFKLGIIKNLILLFISFPITAGLALYCGMGLPVLPFMGALFIIGNYRSLSVDEKERKQLIGFIVAIIIIFAFISFFIK